MKEKKECLIIDDDQDDQEIFLMCLKAVSRNVNCVAANNGVEAISMLSGTGYVPDYIFLDVNMPMMNGIECLKELKSLEQLNQTKIFMYSTTSEDATLTASKELGADDFIVKPAKTKDLKEKLFAIFEIVSDINSQNPI